MKDVIMRSKLISVTRLLLLLPIIAWSLFCLPVIDQVYWRLPLFSTAGYGRTVLLGLIGLVIFGIPMSVYVWRRQFTDLPLRTRCALSVLVCIMLILGAYNHLPLPKPIHERQVPVEISFRSITNSLSDVSRFYLLRIEDSSGRIHVSANDFTNAPNRVSGGAVVNNGHGLWSSIPSMGPELQCNWSGMLMLPSEVELLLRAASSTPGSTLQTTVTVDGHTHSQICTIPETGKDATTLIPLIYKPAFSRRLSLLITLFFLVPGIVALAVFLQSYRRPPRDPASACSKPSVSSLETGAILLLAFPFWCAMVVAISLLLGGTVQRFVVPLATFLSLGTGYLFSRQFSLPFGRDLAWAGIVIVVSIFLSSLLWDDGWDTNVYHYPMAELLKDGWNPVYQPQASDALLGKDGLFLPLGHHVNVVPKAQAYIAAAIGLYFKHPESGNFTNLLFIIVCAIVAYHAFRTFITIPRILCMALALALALNPVAVAQWQSGFVDGRLGSLLSISLLSGLAFVKSGKKRFLWYSLFSLPMAICLKLSAFVYLGFFWFALLVFCSIHARCHLRTFLLHLCALGILTGILGFHPYVTNITRHKTPFYPVLTRGNEKQRYLQSGTFSGPSAIKSLARVNAFAASHILASPGSTVPLDFSGIADYSRIYATTHIGMYGPLHSKIVLPAALILLLCSLLTLRDKHAILTTAILLSIISCPAPWYSRYVPQIYLFTALSLGVFSAIGPPAKTAHRRYYELASFFLIFTLLCNSILVAMNMAYKTVQVAANTGRVLHAIMDAPTIFFIDTDAKYMPNFRYLNRKRMAALGKNVDIVADDSITVIPIRSSMLFYGLAVPTSLEGESHGDGPGLLRDFLYSCKIAAMSNMSNNKARKKEASLHHHKNKRDNSQQ